MSYLRKMEYGCFLRNDKQLAEIYGKNMPLFKKNKADIDYSRLSYEYVKLNEAIGDHDSGELLLFSIQNYFDLKIRPERQIAEVLGLSRSQIQKMLQQGDIKFESISPRFVSFCLNV